MNYKKTAPNYQPTKEIDMASNTFHLSTSTPKIQCSKCFNIITEMSCHMTSTSTISGWQYVCNSCYQVGPLAYNPTWTVDPGQTMTRCDDCGMGTGFQFHMIQDGIGGFKTLCSGCYGKRQAYPNTYTSDRSAKTSADTCECVRCPHCKKVVK